MKLIGFSNPLALLLLSGIIPLILWNHRSNADLPPGRKRAAFITRLIIYILIVLALSGLRLYLPTDKMCVTFLVDDSESAPEEHLKFAWDYIEKSMKSAHYGDKVNIALFGEDVYLDQTLEGQGKTEAPSTRINGKRTNISQALSFAEGMSAQDTIGRIVLFSDGNENVGNAKEEGIIAGIQGTGIWTVPYPASLKHEVMVRSLDLPEKCNLDEPFELKVTLESDIDTDSQMKVFLNGLPVARDRISVHPGENIFYIPQNAVSAGTYSYEVIIEPENDGNLKNNRANAVTFIQGKPKVLYLTDFGSSPGPVASFVRDSGIDVYCGDPQHLPKELEGFRNYQGIIFSNLPASSLSKRQMDMIKSYVQDLGGGFIMIGGMGSFGIGGYYHTPVEEILPVEMDVRKKKILPQAALILVIDKSGSMEEEEGGRKKVDLAKEAAIVTLEVLSSQDIIGVIGFDSAAKWVVTPARARDKNKMAEEIATIRAGGGTNLYPALEAAIDEMKGTGAALKHIIVLSDGRTEPGNFEKLTEKAVKARITVTAVSVGKDSDIPFMESLARQGKGRSYYTDDARLLPRIFVKDTFIASQSATLEEPFVPKINESHPALSGIDFKSSPIMKGYCITAEKSLATVPLISHKKDALLALWRTGLGKSAAFTSDEGERWAKYWYDWDEAAPLWQQIVRWSLPQVQSGDYTISTEIDQDNCSFSVEATDEKGNYLNFLNLTAKVISPEVETLDVSLSQVAPGKYRGEFQAGEAGNYIVTMSEAGSGSNSTFAISIPYSPEYKEHKDNTVLLHKLAESSDGEYSPPPESVFVHPGKSAYTPRDTWEKLLLMALLLFPFDVALRRVFLPADWLDRILGRRVKPGITAGVEEAAPSTLASLKSKKKEIASQYSKDTTIEQAPVIQDHPENVGAKRGHAPTSNDSKSKPSIKPTLSQDSITYLERLKQAKKKAIKDD